MSPVLVRERSGLEDIQTMREHLDVTDFVIDAERQYEEEPRTEEGPEVLPQTVARFAPASVHLGPH
ncbi:hypothetical protein TRAPUB_14036 [Trametes pubescens]|uniref:Uncharacterized protein n=1 Tax=Trametes pubescens TaxID=154538 RepID=A0A1M2VPQ2_TRAPU|nr:hypothetical protein TRAPUB_14036 [Trametes pubescens]